MSLMEKSLYGGSRFRNYIVVLSVTVLAISFHLVYSYESNIPQWDDFSLSLVLLWLKGNADGPLAFISTLFSQFYEHKLVVYRLIAYSDYLLTGQVDFKQLAYIGNSVNVILMLLLCKTIKNDSYGYLPAVPVILLFLVSLQWSEQIWRNGAGATYVLCFSGLAFYFAVFKNNTGALFLLLAFVFSTLAVFSTANGLLVSPILVAYFLYRGHRSQSIFWAMASFAQWLFYFLCDYEKVPYKASSLALLDKAQFFIVSTGSAISFGNLTVAMILGLILIVSIAGLAFKRHFDENPTVFIFLIFNLLTIAAVSWGRSRYGLETALSERYLYTSMVTVMLVYMGLQEILFKLNRQIWCCFVCSMVFISFAIGIYSCFIGIALLDMEKSKRINSINQWLIEGDGLRFTATLESDFVLSTMLKSGFYSIPSEIVKIGNNLQEVKFEGLCGTEGDGRFNVAYDVIKIPSDNANSPLIRVAGVVVDEIDSDKPLYVVLKSSLGQSHVYPVRMVKLQRLELSALGEGASRRRFVGLVPAGLLRKGRYDVGICDGERVVYNEPHTLVKSAFAAGLWRIHWIKRFIIEERRGLIAYAQSVSSLSFEN